MNMFKYIYLMMLSSLMLFNSCEMKNELRGDSNKDNTIGLLQLDLKSQKEWGDTKANGELDINEFPVEITNVVTNEVVKSYSKYSELKAESPIALPSGEYKVKAHKGTFETASREPYYEGETNFSIAIGKTTNINTVCKLKYFKVALNFEATFFEAFNDDYTVSITNGTGIIICDKSNLSPAYFAVNENAKDFTVTMKVTNKLTNLDIQKSYNVAKNVDIDNGYIQGGDLFNITFDKVDDGGDPGVGDITTVTLGISVDLTMNATGEKIGRASCRERALRLV